MVKEAFIILIGLQSSSLSSFRGHAVIFKQGKDRVVAHCRVHALHVTLGAIPNYANNEKRKGNI